ncbi:hypothetical protein C8Q79DRAFT_1117150 [Trametes meyenii]|nr:hypothetical protein C8Q79DRAFT_1117150 [Trametes meyenii]
MPAAPSYGRNNFEIPLWDLERGIDRPVTFNESNWDNNNNNNNTTLRERETRTPGFLRTFVHNVVRYFRHLLFAAAIGFVVCFLMAYIVLLLSISSSHGALDSKLLLGLPGFETILVGTIIVSSGLAVIIYIGWTADAASLSTRPEIPPQLPGSGGLYASAVSLSMIFGVLAQGLGAIIFSQPFGYDFGVQFLVIGLLAGLWCLAPEINKVVQKFRSKPSSTTSRR